MARRVAVPPPIPPRPVTSERVKREKNRAWENGMLVGAALGFTLSTVFFVVVLVHMAGGQ